jgi:Zn finger protein HypA/HybF involved in hydrogenase expression
MKLRDVLDHDRLLLVACNDCHGKTPLDPAGFALRVGAHTDVADLIHDLTCPVCGSAEIELGSHSPVEARRRAAGITPDARP